MFDGSVAIARHNNGGSAFTSAIIGPNKIYYTDDANYRNGRCIRMDADVCTLQLYDLGMVKNTYWAFEEEWRYKFVAGGIEFVLHGAEPTLHPLIDVTKYPVKENPVFIH